MKRLLRSLWRCCWLTVALALIAAAVVLTVARLALPFAGGYQDAIEAAIGDYLGAEVRAADIDLEWYRLGPRLRLDALRVTHPDGDVIRFDSAFVEIGLGGGVTDVQIRNVILAGLDLDVRIDEEGRLHFWGLDVDPRALGRLAEGDMAAERPSGDGPDLLAGLLQIERLHLTDATIRLRTAAGRVHAIRDGELRLRNDGNRHRLALDARPPADWGERLHVIADGSDLLRDPDEAGLHVHAVGDDLDLARAGGLLPRRDGAPAIGAGRADIAVWADWRGAELQGITTDLASRGLALEPGAGHDYRLDEFAGRFDWRRSADGWRLRGEDITVGRDGESWRAERGEIERRAGEWHVHGDRLAIADLAEAAPLLPVSGEIADALAAFAPSGWLDDYHLAVADEGGGFRLGGDFADLGWSPAEGWPALSGLDGRIEATPQGAHLDLAATGAAFFAPTLFREPLRLDALSGRVDIERRGADWVIDAPVVDARNPDITTRSRMRLELPAADEPWLDLQVDFRDGDAATTSRYLPVGIMFPELIDWLDRAIVDGHVPSGHALFNGPLGDFPFDDRPGVFEVDFEVRDLTLDYAPDWPVLDDVAARVHFHGPSLDIEGRSARIYDSPIADVHARFADLRTGELAIAADATPRMPDLLRLSRETPLRDRLGPFFDGARSDGARVAGMRLDLDIPVADTASTRVAGHIDLAGNRLEQPRFWVDLADIEGRVGFTDDSLSMAGVEADFHGQPITIDAATDPEGVRLTARGDLDLGAMLPPEAAVAARHLHGAAPWEIRVAFAEPDADGLPTHTRIEASSPLTGTAVDLPHPFTKAAGAARPLRVDLPVTAGRDRHPLFVRYGDEVALAAELEVGNGLVAPRGELWLGEGGPSLPDGPRWHLGGAVDYLDLAAWADVVRAVVGEQGEGAADPGVPGRGLWGGVELQAGALQWGAHRLTDTALSAAHDDGAWRFALDSNEAAGQASWSPHPADGGRLRGAFTHIDLDALRPDDADAGAHPARAAADPLDPRDLPPLDVRIEQLRYGDFRFDDVALITTPTSAGLAIHRLQAANAHLGLEGQGQWLRRGGEHRTHLRLSLDTDNFGAGLGQAGWHASGFLRGSGGMTAEADWSGPPWAPELTTLSGQMQIELADGVVTAVDPGPARLISLFSLQSLSRRLALDFAGLFRSGFEYDHIRGRLNAEQGNVYVDRLEMQGPAGRARVNGRIGLVARDFDQHIEFRPGLNYSLPVIGAIAGGPAGGLTVALVQQLMRGLGADWETVAEVHYALTGSWAEPNVERIRIDNDESLLEPTGPGPAGDPRRR